MWINEMRWNDSLRTAALALLVHLTCKEHISQTTINWAATISQTDSSGVSAQAKQASIICTVESFSYLTSNLFPLLLFMAMNRGCKTRHSLCSSYTSLFVALCIYLCKLLFVYAWQRVDRGMPEFGPAETPLFPGLALPAAVLYYIT